VRIIDGKIKTGIYNVVEHNMSINQVASELKSLYPKLDVIHANHNIRMKDVLTSLPCTIWDQIPLPSRSFNEELHDFKLHFSF